jgi:hypothetical protein
MDKKYCPFIFNTFNGFLFSLSSAMGAGTFIESKYNTDTARIMIYNAWWFEVLVLFVINFIGNIKRYPNLKKKNGPLTLLLSWIFIISGHL